MKLALIGSARFGIAEPVAGGLESMLLSLSVDLARLGHAVTVFAGTGEDATTIRPGVRCIPLTARAFVPSPSARGDVSMPSDRFMAEHHAYLTLGQRLRGADVDVVHNHSLHYLPPLYDIAVPMVHTLHSPPTPWLESAYDQRARTGDLVVSVSNANAALWGGIVDEVVPNGVDLDRWDVRTDVVRGRDVVWSGRLVPEKGAHLAIDAALAAGRGIDLAGPVHDAAYFAAEIAPRLGPSARYLGHLAAVDLAEVVRRAAVAVVSPLWDEPYGLVVAEALALGTPVATFARGGIPDLLDDSCGVLAEPGDVAALAVAIEQASRLSPASCRQRAAAGCSSVVTAERYVELYESVRAVASAGVTPSP
jgi:glycosyltransferase involved in cell wall biosynthesis